MATPLIIPAPPVPRIALPNPHLRKPSLSTHIASLDSLRNSGFDLSFPVPHIPKDIQINDSASEIGQAVSEYSPIDSAPKIPTPLSAAAATTTQKYTPKQTSKLSHASPPSKSDDSGYLSSSSPDTSKSPVVPIRSMFPVYDPSVSLQAQQYHPQLPRPRPLRQDSSSSRRTTQDYPTSFMTPIDRVLSSPPPPPSMFNIQLDAIAPRMSTPKELNELWEASQGMEPNPRIKSYKLELARYVLQRIDATGVMTDL